MPADRSPAFAPRAPVRSLVYRGLLALAHACYKAGNGALFTAAGLLRRDELQAASVAQYREFNVSAIDVDGGLNTAEAHFYGQFLRPRARVLLAGCGTGRDLIALQLLGHQVIGIEPAPEVAERARQHLARRGSAATVETGLIQTIELRGSYDAVIFSNGCYSFLQGSAVRIATLRRVAAHLAPSGRIIVSYYPARPQSHIGRQLTRVAARVSGADWSPERGDTFSREGVATELIRFHHAFEAGDFAAECDAAGLTVLAEKWYEPALVFAAAERRT